MLLLLTLGLLFPRAASGAIGIDAAAAVTKGQGASSSIVSPAFSSTSTNELLLALIASDGSSGGTNVVVNNVTGAGLTWVLVRRTNVQRGAAEIWRAFAPTPLSRVTVTATFSQSVSSSITVMGITGVDPSGTSGSGAIGATGTGNSSTTAPTATLVTTRANSLVIGVGNDWDQAVARTLGPNQVLVSQYLSSVGDTYWVQRQAAVTPAAGSSVTINDTAPTGHRYNLTICEILVAPAAATTFSLSGTVTPTPAGGGVAIAVTGPGSANTTTNSSGGYTVTGLANGTYTITPSKTGGVFSPSSQTVTINGANMPGIDFGVATHSISGKIDGGGGSTVTLSGAAAATQVADASGHFNFTGLLDGSYTVTPSQTGLTYSPGSQGVVMAGADITNVAFTALYSISGTITGGGGATVALTRDATASVTADGSGKFTFSGLPLGNYTVTPSKGNLAFSPSSLDVAMSSGSVTGVNFTAVTFSISGTITGPGAATVALTGDASATVTADASGNYSFSGLNNGSYAVTPSKTGFTFTQTSQPVTINGGNVTAINFDAPTYTISGTITGAAGTNVSLSGAATATMLTDGLGNYSFNRLGNGSYVVTPSGSGFTFSPVNLGVTITGANQAAVNFNAQLVPPSPLTIDVTVSTDRTSPGTSVVTPAFSTAAGNELLLAMVGADVSSSAGTNNSVTSVTGAGLTWVLVQRTNTQRGTAEIWRAFATAPLTNVTVTANLTFSNVSSITVMSFRGVNTSGTNGSGAIGNTGTGSGATGVPTASLVTLGSNSLVVGVGEDWNAAPSVTAGTNQAVVHQLAVPNLATFWAQRQNATTPTIGTTVTMNDTVPTNHQFNFAICEIIPGVSGPPVTYSLSGIITPSAGGVGATVSLTGTASASTTTNSSGAYAFSGLANGPYTVTPSNAGYVFLPANHAVTINGSSVTTGADFTAVPAGQTFSISGTVTSAASGALMTLTGAASTTAVADGSGNYSFSGLVSGGYTVTPSKNGFNFAPPFQSVTVTNASISGVNFTPSAAAVTVSISPTSPLIFTGGTQQFTATVTGAVNMAVTWSATSGTVSSSGLYTAPNTTGTYTVTATSVADTTKSASATVTVTTPTSSTLLLGDSNVETQADASLPLGQAKAFQVTAGATGSVQSLAVYLDPSSTVSTLVAGLYSNSGGHPGSLLSQGNSSQLVPGAWNTITVASTAVTAGTSYWVAILGTSTGGLVFREGLGGSCAAETSAETSLAALSSTWTTGASSSVCPVSAFADSTKVFFYDTFAGTALSRHWTVISRHGEYAQNESECNIPQQVSVNNGLTITTAAQTWTCGDFHPDGTVWHAPSSWPYVTGDIQWGSLNFTYGTVEIRAKFPPKATSLWPATWLLGNNCQASNPFSGDTGSGAGTCPDLVPGYTEIDMTECYGGSWCQFHVANPSFGIGGGCDTSDYDPGSSFHVYKTVWESNRVRQYIDGTLLTTCNQSLNKPMFLIIQIQTGGVGGTPNNALLPASLVIDYVKVTQP